MQSDKIQKDIKHIRQNTKRQNTNVTKLKRTKYKYDKIQKDNSRIRQNTEIKYKT